MSWLDTDPLTWKTISAGMPQDCPDMCGQPITVGTTITSVAGAWRRYDCVQKQWDTYQNMKSGTQSDFLAACKRLHSMGGYVVCRGYDENGPRTGRWKWTEAMP